MTPYYAILDITSYFFTVWFVEGPSSFQNLSQAKRQNRQVDRHGR